MESHLKAFLAGAVNKKLEGEERLDVAISLERSKQLLNCQKAVLEYLFGQIDILKVFKHIDVFLLLKLDHIDTFVQFHLWSFGFLDYRHKHELDQER